MIVIAACIPHHTRGKGENPGLSLNAKNIRFQDDASTNKRLFGSVKYSRLGYPD
ncbi:uncharacterized protein An14g04360 [Aspergillus niger]|uniref:Contig An14c0140, genomic contig n=2 Tax=Aspergillus niger TaxID=5061 RepID=A2R3I0_ASPNC|nr:uncharacterized protein An14g04360 [Aspergillus niger]CAK48528.1 unnamed protein product [Aspergillus niger]